MPAQSFANIYLARKIDTQIKEPGMTLKKNLIYKKKLHDIFKILKGTTKELHNLVDEMIRIHPTLTINHTAPENEADCDKCDCETKTSIPFLDTLFSIENGKIDRNG